MKPIIGITTDLEKESKHILNHNYVKAIINAGGLPILLPSAIEEDVKQLSATLDGLLLTGGGDIDPTLFEEEPHPRLGEVSPTRDSIEMELVQEVLRLNKPMLGICRGHQMINIAFGGNIYQDIQAQYNKSPLQHAQKSLRSHPTHFIQVEKGKLLTSIAETSKFKVNSFHHQAVKDVREPLIVSGVASDGIIEAIESTAHRFVLGVQWHPEELAEEGDPISARLFKRFIEVCSEGGKIN